MPLPESEGRPRKQGQLFDLGVSIYRRRSFQHRPGFSPQSNTRIVTDELLPLFDRPAEPDPDDSELPNGNVEAEQESPEPVVTDEGSDNAPDLFDPSAVSPATEPPTVFASGEKAKAQDILTAIRVLKAVEQDKRPATQGERRALARFAGFGPVAGCGLWPAAGFQSSDSR